MRCNRRRNGLGVDHCNHGVEHPPSVDAEQVRQDATDPETVMVERLVDAITGPTAADEFRSLRRGTDSGMIDLCIWWL